MLLPCYKHTFHSPYDIACRNIDHLDIPTEYHRLVLVVHNDNSRLIGDNKQEAADNTPLQIYLNLEALIVKNKIATPKCSR